MIMESLERQLDLLKKIVAPNRENNFLSVDISRVEKIIREEIPKALEKQAPPNFPELYYDFEYVYSRFYDFLLFEKLIGRNIVALGGSFSSGKSSFLNSLMGLKGKEKILPVKLDASTSVPTYLISESDTFAFGINEFNVRVALELADIKIIVHGFGVLDDAETNQNSITLGHLLRSLFVATPLLLYKNIAFLDTPGYSKPDSADYTSKTDEKIARVQLNSSSHILWFISADSGIISMEDIEFLRSIDRDIPKLIIINKADKAPSQVALDEMKSKVKSVLDVRGVKYEDILTFSVRDNVSCDREAVKNYLSKLDEKQEQAGFAHSFKKLFVSCNDYYNERINENNLSLSRLNRALTLAGDNAEVNHYLSNLSNTMRENIQSLKNAKENLKKLQQEFFTEIKVVADKVNITMPEPSEIDLVKDSATDPATIVRSILQKRNVKTDPTIIEELRRGLDKIDPKMNELLGGSGYKQSLLNILKENFS